jgi:ParB family chromosome partitioning protein
MRASWPGSPRVCGYKDSSSPSPCPNSDGYEIIAGARRFRAAQLAEFQEMPVRVVDLSDEQALEWTLIENSQRVDVHPYEEAQGLRFILHLVVG